MALGASSEQKMDPWYLSDSHENLVIRSGPCARQGGMVFTIVAQVPEPIRGAPEVSVLVSEGTIFESTVI